MNTKTVTTCKTCRGAKLVYAVPRAQQIHADLLPDDVRPGQAWLLCPSCKGSGRMIGVLPYPKRYILL